MTEVYLVSSGSYSDYSIEAVFSTEKKAQEFIDALHWPEDMYSCVAIEPFELDKPYEVIPGYLITMSKDGQVLSKKLDYYLRSNAPAFNSVNISRGVWFGKGQFDGEALQTEVQTEDEERAIKVTNERRTRLIAENRWVEGYGIGV